MLSYLRPSTHRRTSSNTRPAGLRRVGRLIDPPQPDLPHYLRLVKGRMVPYHALHPCLLPRPKHLSYLHPPYPLHPVPLQPPRLGSTPNTKYTHSHLSSIRRLCFSPRLPHTRLICRSIPSRISSTKTTSSPCLSPSACKAAHSPPFYTPPEPAHPLSPPLAVAPSSDNPSAETSRTTSCRKSPPQLPPTPRHRLPYRPKPPFRYRLPHPLLLLPRP
jgi:hypothetical protein